MTAKLLETIRDYLQRFGGELVFTRHSKIYYCELGGEDDTLRGLMAKRLNCKLDFNELVSELNPERHQYGTTDIPLAKSMTLSGYICTCSKSVSRSSSTCDLFWKPVRLIFCLFMLLQSNPIGERKKEHESRK